MVTASVVGYPKSASNLNFRDTTISKSENLRRITSSNGTYGPEPLVKRFSTHMSAVDKPFGASQLNWREDVVGSVPHLPIVAACLLSVV